MIMPYISIEDRNELDNGAMPETAGELNYMISSLLDEYLTEKGKNYNNINEVIGMLECAKLELYRRVAAPYEDEKIDQNGDVFDVIKVA
jgi:hypothetical protein|tara:strand:+ start:312 stop:578 length:267 start_codon:yes stop_codon:yes gene_type:complete